MWNQNIVKKKQIAFPETPKGREEVLVQNHVIRYIYREGVGKFPNRTDIVSVYFTCYLINGIEIASCKQNVCNYFIGCDRLIPGLEIALSKCKVGQKFKLIISSHYAYGYTTNIKFIPPGSKLIFNLQIVEIISGSKREFSEIQIYAQVFFDLRKADQLLNQHQYQLALQLFSNSYYKLKRFKFHRINIKQKILYKQAQILHYLDRDEDALFIIETLIRQDYSHLGARKLKLQIYKQKSLAQKLYNQIKEYYNKYYLSSLPVQQFYVEYLKFMNLYDELISVPNYDIANDKFKPLTKKQHINDHTLMQYSFFSKNLPFGSFF